MRIIVTVANGRTIQEDLNKINGMLAEGILDGDELAWSRPTGWVTLCMVKGIILPTPLSTEMNLNIGRKDSSHNSANHTQYNNNTKKSSDNNVEQYALPEVKNKAVGGWLLYFCIQCTILGPIIVLYSLPSMFDSIHETSRAGLDVANVFIVDLAVTVLISIYGIIIGSKVWGTAHKANLLAIQYLWITMIANAVWTILFISFVANSSIESSTYSAVIKNAIMGVAFKICWILYFIKSKRVFNTFS